MSFKKRHIAVVSSDSSDKCIDLPFVGLTPGIRGAGRKGAVWGAPSEEAQIRSKRIEGADARSGCRVYRISTIAAKNGTKLHFASKKWRGSGEGSSSEA